MQERRLHQRQRLDARVRLYHPVYGTLDGRIRDLSNGGMFVLLDRALPSRLAGAFPEGVAVERVGLKEAVTETGAFIGQFA